jgi:hypothetical protein
LLCLPAGQAGSRFKQTKTNRLSIPAGIRRSDLFQVPIYRRRPPCRHFPTPPVEAPNLEDRLQSCPSPEKQLQDMIIDYILATCKKSVYKFPKTLTRSGVSLKTVTPPPKQMQIQRSAYFCLQ